MRIKRFFTGLIIALVVLIVLPIALLFIFFFDTGKMKVNYDENFTKDKWSMALVVDSLDDTETEKALSFSVSENDINNFIYSAIKDNEELNKYLTQLAIDIKEDSYVLNVSGKAFFFETRAKLTTTLSKDKVNDQDAFILTVDKMSLGRLTKLKEVIMFFVKKFVNDQTIDALASQINLHADLENSRLYIYTSDLREMINKGVNGGSGTSEFYFAFINDFLDKNLINIDFYGDESLTVNVNLEPLTGNDYDASAGENVYYPMPYENTTTYLTIDEQPRKLSLDTIRDALVSLLDQKVITTQELTSVSNFLFQGNKGTNVPEADLSYVGIMDKNTYPGFGLVTSSSIDSILTNAVSKFEGYSISQSSFDIANISEADINLFLKSQGVFGNKYFLTREIEDDKNKINYIALDNAYMNLYGNTSVISVGLNINGLETMVTLKMELDPSNTDAQKLVYLPAKVYFGKEAEGLLLSEDTEKLVFDTLANTVNQSSFKFDSNGKMTISFDALVDQAIDSINTGNALYDSQYKNFLRNDANIAISIDGNAVTDNSLVKIQAVRR